MSQTNIGFPSALTHFVDYPMWRVFFGELGFECVASPFTNRSILDRGTKETVSDACVPIKLFHGHAAQLKNKVTYLFVPRMVNVDKDRFVTFCPKFLGLPDMLKASIVGLPRILEAKFDRREHRFYVFDVCKELGKQLDRPIGQIFRAYRKGKKAQMEFERIVINNQITPDEAMNVLFHDAPIQTDGQSDLRIAVLGYPYQVYDEYISGNMIHRLRELGAKVSTVEMVPYKTLLKYSNRTKKKLFWHFSNRVLWACYHYLEQGNVDGIIHVTAFGCGPDSMVDKLLELECKHRDFPFLSLVVDEHTGEGGILTRLEAFTDLIRFRRGEK